jgi:hypothetical protein
MSVYKHATARCGGPRSLRNVARFAQLRSDRGSIFGVGAGSVFAVGGGGVFSAVALPPVFLPVRAVVFRAVAGVAGSAVAVADGVAGGVSGTATGATVGVSVLGGSAAGGGVAAGACSDVTVGGSVGF